MELLFYLVVMVLVLFTVWTFARSSIEIDITKYSAKYKKVLAFIKAHPESGFVLNKSDPSRSIVGQVRIEEWNQQMTKYGRISIQGQRIQRSLYTSTGVAWYHCWRFQYQIINFMCKFVSSLVYALKMWFGYKFSLGWHKEYDDQIVIDLFFNTTASCFSTFFHRDQRTFFKLTLKGIALPSFAGKLDSTVDILISIPSDQTLENRDTELDLFDIYKRKITTSIQGGIIERFDINDQNITSPKERMMYVEHLIVTVIHPMVHSFFTPHYEGYAKSSPVFEDLFRDGIHLNFIADEKPERTFGIPFGWLTILLNHNSELALSNHVKTVTELSKYSLFYRFLLHARIATFRAVENCKQRDDVQFDVHPLKLFIISVLHSIDHYFCGFIMDPCYGDYVHVFHSRMFYYPSQWPFDNYLVSKVEKDQFYKEWYEGIQEGTSTIPDKYKDGWMTLLNEVTVSMDS